MAADEPLLNALRSGDLTALVALRSRYERRLRRIAMSVVRDRQVADEIISDVCTDFALDHAPNLREASAVGSYLRLMTIRRARRRMGLMRKHDPCAADDLSVMPLEDEMIAQMDAGKR
mgnify:CR=1 FL=1